MNHPKYAFGLLILLLLLISSGCTASEPEPTVEEVLQLNNDILDDPLLKELDELEASLLVQDEGLPEPAPTVSTDPAPNPAAPPATENKPVPKTASPVPAASPSQEASVPVTSADTGTRKTVLFGIIRKASESGITLQVIQAKALTADELERIRNGEKIPRTLLTDETLHLNYSGSTEFEKLEKGNPVPAQLSEVMRGQSIRVAVNPSGEIKLLRIIRY